jgi:lysine 2,3-aminomutase
LKILTGLRGHTTGYAVPTYAIDVPGGGGKIPILPDSKLERDGDYILLRNFEGDVYRFPDPVRPQEVNESKPAILDAIAP